MPKHRPKNQPDVEQFVKQYEAGKGLYVDFTGKLKLLVQDLLDSRNIRYQVVESRTKSVDSFREKITRATKHYSEPLKEITDLIGLHIIVYYLDDIDQVRKLLEEEFTVDTDASVDKGSLAHQIQ